jgi:hypothetical protein
VNLQVVQFVGKAMAYSDATEWQVTRAILSNSMAVSTPEGRNTHNQRVDALMREHRLVHIGWLRLVSKANPLSCSDVNTQLVRPHASTRQLREACFGEVGHYFFLVLRVAHNALCLLG